MKPQSDVSLQALNTLAVPARARYLIPASSITDLREALAFTRERALPLLILGGGSNIVLSGDFDGVVIALQLRGITCVAEHEDWVELSVAAGENWDDFVRYSLAQGWFGLENLSAIPGSVGAAPIQNIGAYGVELSSVLTSVVGLDLETGTERQLSREDCELAYRDSIFKGALRDRFVITQVGLRLSKIAKADLSYPALAAEVDASASPQEVSAAVRAVRARKLPSPAELPNAGSFFKNPIVPGEQADTLRERHPTLPMWPHNGKFKLAAGWLVEQAGWRGCSGEGELAGVSIFSEQALVLTNPGRRPGRQILQFAAEIQASVHARFGVNLDIEPRVY